MIGLAISDKVFKIKSTPTLAHSNSTISVNFESGDLSFNKIYLYGEETPKDITYYNTSSNDYNVAWEEGIGTEVEFRYIQFGANQTLSDSDYELLLSAFEPNETNKIYLGNNLIASALIGSNVAKIYFR